MILYLSSSRDFEKSELLQFALFVGVISIFAVSLSILAVGCMMKFTKHLVKISLVFECFTSFTIASLSKLFGQKFETIAILWFLYSIYYTVFFWNKDKFATATLNTALTGMCTFV